MTDSRDLHGAKREMFDQDDSRNLSFWKRSEISVINGVAFVSVLEYQNRLLQISRIFAVCFSAAEMSVKST